MISSKTRPITIEDPLSTFAPSKNQDLEMSKFHTITPTNLIERSTAPTTLKRNHSMSTFNSKKNLLASTFSSFISPTNKSTKSHRNISILCSTHTQFNTVMKSKPDQYLDTQLAENFDAALESGFEKIYGLKKEHCLLKEEEELLKQQISILEREILPARYKSTVLQDKVDAQKALSQKFLVEIEVNTNEIERQKQMISNRKDEFNIYMDNLVNINNDFQTKVSFIKNEIITNKQIHKDKLIESEEILKANKEKSKKTNEEIKILKKEYEKLKNLQNQKVRKMENKTKMFIGLINH